MTGTVVISRTYFFEDDIVDGALINYDRVTVVEDERTDLTAREAADLIIREGLAWRHTGSHWAGDPDGTRIVDYATAERVETCATLHDFPIRVEVAIMEVVDSA